MQNLNKQVAKNDVNKILRGIHAGDLNAVKDFHGKHPKLHWTQIRYEKLTDSVLHAASRLGFIEIIEYLLSNYQPNCVNFTNSDNKTALHEAAQFSQHDVVELLLSKGANVNSLKKADWTPLMLSCTKIDGAKSYRTVDVLLQAGSLVNYANKDGWTALHLIAREGDVNVLKLLIEFGLDVHKRTKNGRYALHIAALHGNYDVVHKLIGLGGDVNVCDSCGNTPLHEAVLGGSLKICGLLLSHNANVDARNKSDLSILHLAAGIGDVGVIAYIIEDLNFDVNVSNGCGYVPLHCAARGKKREAYDFLIKCGADSTTKDNFGRVAAYYLEFEVIVPCFGIEMRHRLDCVSLLTRRQSTNMYNFVPKHQPVRERDVEVLRDFVLNSNKILVVTGAGISTESGIPDYRSEDVGLYARSNHKPIQYQEFLKSPATRQRYWARNFIGWPLFSTRLPNSTHSSIRRLETMNKVSCVVTQNVDGLHHKANSRNVVELHGSAFRVYCLDCRKTYERHDVQKQIQELNPQVTSVSTMIRPDGDVEIPQDVVKRFVPPRCDNCDGVLKPDIVFFGDNVPKERVDLVREYVTQSDSVMVLGSSLFVFSGYRIILQALQEGKNLVIVNIGPTRADKDVSLKITARCGDILPKIFL